MNFHFHLATLVMLFFYLEGERNDWIFYYMERKEAKNLFFGGEEKRDNILSNVEEREKQPCVLKVHFIFTDGTQVHILLGERVVKEIIFINSNFHALLLFFHSKLSKLINFTNITYFL